MKNILRILTVLIINICSASLLMLQSCSKTDDKPAVAPIALYPEENPYTEFLTTSGFDQKTVSDTYGIDYYYSGYKFKPKVNGKINSFVIKVPVSDGATQVMLYKNSSEALLVSKTVVIATNNLEVTAPITPVDLLKNEEYLIILKSTSTFRRSRNDNAIFTLPTTIKNITLTKYFIGSNNPFSYLFNDGFYNATANGILGDVSFNFQPTE